MAKTATGRHDQERRELAPFPDLAAPRFALSLFVFFVRAKR
jgi:hypothetical protein